MVRLSCTLLVCGASAIADPVAQQKLLAAARARMGMHHWAGQNSTPLFGASEYRMNDASWDSYVDESFASSLALFVSGTEPSDVVLGEGAVINCWAFVETSLAVSGVAGWSFPALRRNKLTALERTWALDAWLREAGVLADGAVSEQSTYLVFAQTMAMLGILEARPWASWSDDGMRFNDRCPPPGAVVSFGYTDHFLVSAGTPAKSDTSPYSCRFVHLFRGGCDDQLQCLGSDYARYEDVCDSQHSNLTRKCNMSRVYESDLRYLANVTHQWGSYSGNMSILNNIHMLEPLDGDAGLTHAQAVEAWVWLVTGPIGEFLPSPVVLLQQLYAHNASGVSADSLSKAGINPENLERDPKAVDKNNAVRFLQPLMLAAISRAESGMVAV